MLTDQQLRELLSKAEGEASPSEAFEASLFARLELARSAGRVARGRRPWLPELRWFGETHRLAWIALLLVLAVVLLASLLAGALRQRPVPDLLRTPVSLAPGPVTANLDVGLKLMLPGPPDSIAVDAALGLWEATGGEVVRLNVVTHAVGSALDLGGQSATAMQFSDSWLYVVSRDGGILSKVDDISGQVLATVHIDSPVGLALDGSLVSRGPTGFVAGGPTAPPIRGPGLVVISDRLATVSEYDSPSLKLRWHAPVPGTPIFVAAGGGRIWVGARPSDDPTALVLAVYEAGTGKALGTVRLHTGWTAPRSIAVAEGGTRPGSAWVPDPVAGSVAIVDPASLAVADVIDIGPGVSEASLRPDGSMLLTFSAGSSEPGVANALAVVDSKTATIRRYVIRTDPAGGGRGVVGVTSDTSSDGRGNFGIIWHVWFGMDWKGDPSVGRVSAQELP